jgi:CrcB protein
VAGAFTTFSTFSYEAVMLLQAGEYVRGALYLGGSVVLGLVAIVLGFAVAAALLHGGAER